MNGRSLEKSVLALAFVVAATVGAPVALAAGGHDHDVAAPALKLDNGRRWRTDEPLRSGMTKIRAAVERELPAAHAGTLDNARYDALGTAVEGQIAYIVQKCRLEPAADAVLHGIIGELSDGVAVATGRAHGERRSGVVKMAAALENYAKYFDHPGWRPLVGEH